MKRLLPLALVPFLFSCSTISPGWKVVNRFDELGVVIDKKVAGTDFVESFSKNTDIKARLTNYCSEDFDIDFDKPTDLSDDYSIKYEDPTIDHIDQPITVRFFNKGEEGEYIHYDDNYYDNQRGLYLSLYSPTEYVSGEEEDKKLSFSDIRELIDNHDFISIAIPWPKVKTVDYVWSLNAAIKAIDDYCEIKEAEE